MQRNGLVLILLGGLALAACGGADPGDASRGAPRPGAVETPSAPAGEAVRGGADDPAEAALPVAELPAEGAAGPAPASPSGSPAAPAAEPGQAGADNADAILRRVERAYADVRTMEADFVQHLTVPLLGSTQRSEGRMYQRRPDRFAMRFSDPAGDLMVADGRHFWMYNPSVDRTQVIRARIAEGGAPVDFQQQFLSNPTQRFVATLTGTETVGGRATHAISLVPRGASQYRLIRIWVDQQDNLVRRFEMTEENESVRRIELRNLRLNATLPDSHFQFTPPAGAQIFDQ